MNQRDRANLDFLLSVGAGLQVWFEQASDEDREYAAELLDLYEQELAVEELNLLEEDHGVNFVGLQSNSLQ